MTLAELLAQAKPETKPRTISEIFAEVHPTLFAGGANGMETPVLVIYEAEIYYMDTYGDDAGSVCTRLFQSESQANAWLEAQKAHYGQGRPWVDDECQLGGDTRYEACVRTVGVF